MIMNRINKLFKEKKKNILNIYFTAGYPHLGSTPLVLKSLESSGVDIIEIGMPYSDPVADGETIQEANQVALDNGMSVAMLFEQLQDIRQNGFTVPMVLMGYFNPVFQYGVENFCKKCQEIGIDGLIIPDLPVDEYNLNYKEIFEKYNILNIFLITPQTSDERIRKIDSISEGFIYMVSSASVTGSISGVSQNMEDYFDRVNNLNLKNPRLIGFGINDRATFKKACQYASGAIIGSQFVRVIQNANNLEKDIKQYIESVKI